MPKYSDDKTRAEKAAAQANLTTSGSSANVVQFPDTKPDRDVTCDSAVTTRSPSPESRPPSPEQPPEKPLVPSGWRWFRFENDAINDPKVVRLSASLRWVWVSLLCVASKYDGNLPPVRDVAIMVRMEPKKLEAAIKTLMLSGLFEEVDGAIRPVNWDEMQVKSDRSTERVKRFRNGQRNVTETPYTTPHHKTEQTGQDITKTGQDRTPEAAANLKAANGMEGSKADSALWMDGRKPESKQAESKPEAIKPQAAMNGAAAVRQDPPEFRRPPRPAKPEPPANVAAMIARGVDPGALWDPPKPTEFEVMEDALVALPPERFFAELRKAAESLVSRDNLDENGASIWVRRGSRAEG